MKRVLGASLVVLLGTCAMAQAPGNTYALMLNEAERGALIKVIAAGLAANPSLSPEVTYLLNKINTAGVVTDSKEQTKEQP